MEAELIPSEDWGVDYLATRMISRPHTLEDTGLDHFFVADLLLKHSGQQSDPAPVIPSCGAAGRRAGAGYQYAAAGSQGGKPQ